MPDIFSSVAYEVISEFYGETRSKRSGLPYMNHINEGLNVLLQIGASENAQRGFCLHPMFQEDRHLSETSKRLEEVVGADLYLLALVMEYRNVANAYLPDRQYVPTEDIMLSPLKDVNDMLIADKVQNRKDFERFQELYANRYILEYYFSSWLMRLGVSEEQYKELIKDLPK